MRRHLRYLILLLILLFVAVNEAVNEFRTTSWDRPLWVRVYAVNGDGRGTTDKYIDGLESQDFKPIEKFINREARRHGVLIEAIQIGMWSRRLVRSGFKVESRAMSLRPARLWSSGVR